MTEKPWVPPRLWEGQPAFVVGGGPSLRHFDVERLRGLNVVAVNTSLLKCPWAPFLFYADHRWVDWHLAAVKQFRGTIVSTSGLNKSNIRRRFMKKKPNNGEHPAIELDERDTLMGRDSGTLAINLAYHLGANPIVLAGFDMKFEAVDPKDPEMKALRQPMATAGTKIRAPLTDMLSHWHQEHPVPSREDNYRKRFLSQWPGIKERLNSRGVDVLTLTPTAIKCLEVVTVEGVLCRTLSLSSSPRRSPQVCSTSVGAGRHPRTVVLPFSAA